jgi:hypothetical protein
LQGTRLDVWHNAYNNTVPSVVYSFDPEFKGYFRDWRWATFDTSEGKFTVSHRGDESYLGIYTSQRWAGGTVARLPETGLTFSGCHSGDARQVSDARADGTAVGSKATFPASTRGSDF